MNIQEKSKIEYRSRINRVMHYIDMHLDQTLELKDIAEIANFSPYHFHRTFTFLVGETPIDYIQRIRVEKAASKLLQESPQPIAEIAYSCGFGSISLFNKIFKRYFGITPTQFRKTRRSDHVYHEVLFSKNADEIKKMSEIALWKLCLSWLWLILDILSQSCCVSLIFVARMSLFSKRVSLE